MTDAEFIDLVARMRDAQRAYQTWKGLVQMQEARKLELQVDAELTRRGIEVQP